MQTRVEHPSSGVVGGIECIPSVQWRPGCHWRDADTDADFVCVGRCQITTYRKDDIFDLLIVKLQDLTDYVVRMIGLLTAASEATVSSVAQYDFRGGLPPSGPGRVGAGSGGGDMDDVLRRLGSLENDVSAIKTDVAGIVALLPHMATKADVVAVKVDVMAVKADVMATKADIAGIVNLLPHMATKADVADSKTSIIQWMVGTMIAVAALAFTIAKFVH